MMMMMMNAEDTRWSPQRSKVYLLHQELSTLASAIRESSPKKPNQNLLVCYTYNPAEGTPSSGTLCNSLELQNL